MFSENLSRIAKSRGTTPTAILKKLGLSTSKVTAWNKGSIPKPEVMEQLARELGCSVAEFFVDPDTPVPESPEEIVRGDIRYREVEKVYNSSQKQLSAFALSNLSEDEQDLITIFRTCTRREQHEIMAMMYKYEKEAE